MIVCLKCGLNRHFSQFRIYSNCADVPRAFGVAQDAKPLTVAPLPFRAVAARPDLGWPLKRLGVHCLSNQAAKLSEPHVLRLTARGSCNGIKWLHF